MSRSLILAFILVGCITVAQAQQQPAKGLSFCGWKYKDTNVIRRAFGRELEFLRINKSDTIVDIGSSSGSFEGCLSVIGDLTGVHFVLVDIDSNCLNLEKVNNMVSYYAALKGSPTLPDISIVLNTPDSLYLPLKHYKKAWLFNTLHEIPNPEKMMRDIAAILQSGGELVLMELFAVPKHTIHGGCHKPLLTESEINQLATANGFHAADKVINPGIFTKSINPVALMRFIRD